MPGLNQMASDPREAAMGLNSFPPVWSAGLDDYILSVQWSPDGQYLGVLPSEAAPVIFDRDGRRVASLPPHPGGNGSAAWHPLTNLWATYGQDGEVRGWAAPDFSGEPAHRFSAGPGWAEHMAWNADGTLLGAARDRELLVWEVATGEVRHRWSGHPSTICHFTWNPANPHEVATVGEGGARMWRVGRDTPCDQFVWGGASMWATWSPDGRWLVTADQTPSVHLYDFTRKEPLHIRGFDKRVQAMAWKGRGEELVTANGETLAVWPCTGKRGPEGATPLMLGGHRAAISAVAYCGRTSILASGDQEGTVLLWSVGASETPALLGRAAAKITALAWSPDERALAQADASGGLTVCRLPTRP